MSRYHWRHRQDKNEKELVGYIRKYPHALWIDDGPFDGWCFVHGEFRCCEIKDPEKKGWAHEYTDKQRKLMAEIFRRGGRVWTLRTKDDVAELVNTMPSTLGN